MQVLNTSRAARRGTAGAGPLQALLVAALAAIVLPIAAAAQQQGLKLGYVDSNRIIESSPGIAEAKASYEKEASEWKAALDAKKKELTTLYEDYQKQSAILSPDKKAEKQQAILAKEREMQEYFQQKFGPQGEAGAREKELLKPIYDRVNKAIEEVRAAESYSLIFDIQAGALAAGDPALDLTERVIERLKTQSTASTTPPPAPASTR